VNEVYWFRRTLADAPDGDSWLSAAEQQRLSAMHVPKRHSDWRLGRWTAKQTVVRWLGLPVETHAALAKIEIRAVASGAPAVFMCNSPLNIALSISHRDGVCICAVAPANVDLGCDVETIEPRSDSFIADYFTVHEQYTIANSPASDRMCLVSLIWSAKESALKALKEGLRADTRGVQVLVEDSGEQNRYWSPLQVAAEGRLFRGWWKSDGSSVYTFAADPPISHPILLGVSESCGPEQSKRQTVWPAL